VRGLGFVFGGIIKPSSREGNVTDSTLRFNAQFHLFLTAFSVRPGIRDAIFAHLLPHLC
jgi:hypothetical protein